MSCAKNFELKQIAFDVSIYPVGTENVSGKTVAPYNSGVSLKAGPISGYLFEKWSVNGLKVSQNEIYEFMAKKN